MRMERRESRLLDESGRWLGYTRVYAHASEWESWSGEYLLGKGASLPKHCGAEVDEGEGGGWKKKESLPLPEVVQSRGWGSIREKH